MTKVLGQSIHDNELCLISLKQILVDQHTAEPLLCDVGFDSHVQGDGLASDGCHISEIGFVFLSPKNPAH